jgi:hypothetical protein
MFKLFFLMQVNIGAHEINLALIMDGKEHPGLNKLTVRMYHKLFKRR